MTPPILARVAQLHGSSEDVDCDTISTATSWEYVSKSSSLSDLTRFGAAFSSSSSTSNNHHFHPPEFAQSSVFSTSSSQIQSNQHNNGRGFLPHGIVPLPPPHRNTHHNSNGFNGYRLTQKDLLQPQPSSLQLSSENNGVKPFTASSQPKDDSIPVMRSTSFNLDCAAARKFTYKFRQSSQIPIQAPARKTPSNAQNKPIVFVAENPENGACDVYNVPFQSDIYSLPVDSIGAPIASKGAGGKKVGRSNSICTSKVLSITASNFTTSATNIMPLTPPINPSITTTKASNSSISQHHVNQNQRVKSSEAPSPPIATSSSVSNYGNNINGGTPPPPQRKNNLNRRRSRDENGAACALESCNIKCSPPPLQSQQSSQQPVENPTLSAPNKPPQRWSSLAQTTQPCSSSSQPKKDLLPVSSETPPLSSSTALKQSVVASTPVAPSKVLPPAPPHHQTNNMPMYALIDPSKKKNYSEMSANAHSTATTTSNIVVKPLNTSNSKQESVPLPLKPRSRSVDPTAVDKPPLESQHQQQQHSRQNSKSSVGTSSGNTINANHQRMLSTNNLNFHSNDNPNSHPLPPEPIENSPGKESNVAHATTADRRNPLGLSFLNLFRRNKTSGTGNGGSGTSGKQQNIVPHHPGTRVVDESERYHHFESEFMSLIPQEDHSSMGSGGNSNSGININNNKEDASYFFRELPPPPPGEHTDESGSEGQNSPLVVSPMECRDFAASIERVKDCGWYWGPLSSESAEDLLKNEPDGSFIVRDSSDARYIFSLTFKLHGLVRHVRIEHDQGNFSFGPLTRFKAATIVDFVEKAVAHSRSGRYLFFLHRRPVLGPMQVQLLHPYSRFMHPRSLKHMCRFVILKYVRRDLIHTLPLPKPLQEYLNTPHYYFENPDRVGGGRSIHDAEIVDSGSFRNGGDHHHFPPPPTANDRVV